MKIKIFKGNWNVESVKSDKDKIYVFGDNDARLGKGGQAVIRGLKNSMGIRTKKGPSRKSAAYYKDEELELNKRKIQEDILNIKYRSISENKTIVLSNGGYGTGLANLKEKSPKTFNYLNLMLKSHFGFDNERGVSFSKIPGHDEIINAKSIELKTETITPINNTLFKVENLEAGLYTNIDLIKSDKKIAITSTKKFNINDVLIVKEDSVSLVCRVVDSYSIDLIDQEYWSEFEGYSKEFKIDFNLKLYQTHINYICSLDKNGKMVFKDDLFGEPVSLKKNSSEKILGDPIKTEKVKEKKDVKYEKPGFFNKKPINYLLNDIGINTNEYKLISDKNSKFYGLWKVKYNGFNFYFKLKRGIFKNKLELIFIKNV